MKEIWKYIPMTNNKYEVSNLGRIKKDSLIKELVLNKKNGYYYIYIGNYKKSSVHRLVASAFCKNINPSKYKEVNHKDGDKLNNKASNLEWVDRKLNMKHASLKGLININSQKRKEICKENQKKSIEKITKKCVEYDNEGKLIKIHNSYNDINKTTTRMYRLSYRGHYFRDYNILIEKFNTIPKIINIEKIKEINNKKPKKYISIRNNEKTVYLFLKDLPITREQLWFCFNNDILDKENRMWYIKNR